jgi:hypothetical protein
LCFEIGRYLPAIALASQSAELILDRDLRIRTVPPPLRQDGERVTLCTRNLIVAREVGLPTEQLLSPNEKLEPDASILFVARSDKVARGDVSSWFRAISEYLPSVEHDALDQLEKAQRFVVAWFNTFPDAPRGQR